MIFDKWEQSVCLPLTTRRRHFSACFFGDYWWWQCTSMEKRQTRASFETLSVCTSCSREIQQFRCLSVAPDNIVTWWESQQQTYPTLAKLVRVVLAIPATSLYVDLYSAFLRKAPQMRSDMDHTVLPCLPLLPSRRTSPPFGWYSFYRPMEGRRLNRPKWSVIHTEIKCRLRESKPDTATHPSTNRAQRRLTSLI